MYFSSNEALSPKDLARLRAVLQDVCREREISPKGKGAEEVAQELINLWHAGFRSDDELMGMLKPINLI